MNLRMFTNVNSVKSRIVTFQVSPDQLNRIQVGMVWRESQAKMAMALQYLVDDINRCWRVLFYQSVKLVLRHFMSRGTLCLMSHGCIIILSFALTVGLSA